jgi:hypothetical protein
MVSDSSTEKADSEMELFIRDCCPHGLAKRTVVTVVTTKARQTEYLLSDTGE